MAIWFSTLAICATWWWYAGILYGYWSFFFLKYNKNGKRQLKLRALIQRDRNEMDRTRKTYSLVFHSSQLMGCQCNHASRYSMESDWQHNIQHLNRMCQCMDWHISDSRMILYSDNRYSLCIRDGIQRMDHHSNQANMNMSQRYFLLYKRHLHRMVMDYMVRLFLDRGILKYWRQS